MADPTGSVLRPGSFPIAGTPRPPVDRVLISSPATRPQALGPARPDRKLKKGELEAALAHLREAGFAQEKIGVYLLIGLPDQEEAEVVTSIKEVKALGTTPVLALYSPIPGTALWNRARATSRYDLDADPLFHNNSLFPCWPQFSWERYSRLKRLAGK